MSAHFYLRLKAVMPSPMTEQTTPRRRAALKLLFWMRVGSVSALCMQQMTNQANDYLNQPNQFPVANYSSNSILVFLLRTLASVSFTWSKEDAQMIELAMRVVMAVLAEETLQLES